MALEKCPECGGQLSTTARFCPHCGYVRAQKIALAIALAGALALLGAVLVFLTSMPHH